jgi:Zn-dependent alcohol dehydrogenase
MGNVSPGAHFSYDACDIIQRRLTLTGVHNYDTRHLQMAIDFLDLGRERIPFRDIVTHTASLNDICEGLRLAESGQAIRVAVLP